MAVTSPFEFAARMFEKPERKYAAPGDLARALDPRTKQTPALDLIDEALVELFDTPDGRLIISMPPQEGKSTRVAKDFITWVHTMNPDCRVVTASYGQTLANRNGLALRRNITDHIDLNLAIAPDNGAKHEWEIAGKEGGVLAVGVGGGLTGRPADLLVIDDPIKDRKEADSALIRDNVWEWWTDSASTRLAPGAPVVLILTRWHEDDLAGRLKAAEDGGIWRVVNIPAQADHDPAKGETDPLGREPGEFMKSARGRTDKQWEAIKVRVGSRTWNALYQGRPSPAEGDTFERGWWQEYDSAQWIEREDGSRIGLGFDEVIMSWDLTFKDTKASDYVCGQVWGRRGADCYLLDQVLDRMSFVETIRKFRSLTAKWPQATLKLVEDKANGPAVISSLARKVPGIVPEEPVGSKEARAAAVSPLVEGGNVHLPAAEIAPWVDGFIEECASFPNAAHDDQVDAMSQALNRLVIMPLLNGELLDDGDLDEELAEFSISPF